MMSDPAANSEIREGIRALWPAFSMAALFSSAINILYLSSPLYLMQVYNRVLVSENIPTLVLLTIILAIALLTMGALDAIRAQVLIRCGIKLDEHLSKRVFQALVSKSARQGYSKGAQPLRQFDDFRTFITGPGVYFAFDLPWIPIYLALLYFIHPLLGVVATLGAMLLLGLAVLNEAITRKALRAAETSGQQSYMFTDNLLRHADVVVAMGMQPAVERHWQDNRRGMLDQQAFASDRNAFMTASIKFARLLLQSIMLGTGAWLAIDHIIMPATIFAASIVMGRALVPVEQAVATWKQFSAARDAYANVCALLAAYPATGPRTIVPKAQSALTASELEYFSPSRKEAIIRNISFEVEGGQAVGIIGPSGSGKSTLARLLVGAISPSAGKLRFGGLDYAHWEPLEFGRQVGYLPQDVGLFPGSVRDNVARFGDASTEDIIAAAKLAGIHEMILDLPQQYDTVLGPGGIGLSGGQRQRLGLARALIGRPALLVLDEPNANLDRTGEGALKDVLMEVKAQGTTIVLITHRTTILEVVDLLMVLRAGKLDTAGPPAAVYAYLDAPAKAPGKVAQGNRRRRAVS